ncbi:hypothetical protein ES703_121379 [subsurface metagenome]
MAEPHTVAHMRSEFFFPKVSDRSRREKWLAEGGKDGSQRAREIAINILATQKPLAISSDIQAKIKSGVKGMIH